MRSRVKDLHYEYCVPKPVFHFRLYDTKLEPYPETETEEAQAEINSIDIFCNLVT